MNSVGNVQLMQRLNRIKVMQYIRKFSPVSRNQLAVNTNLSLSSITNIVNFLLENKLVVEVGRLDTEGAGRRATLLEFNPGAKHIISVNIEPHEVQAALTDLSGNIFVFNKAAIDKKSDADRVLKMVEKEISKLMRKSDLVIAVGISLPGHISNGMGIVNSSILQWKNVDVKGRIEKAFALPLYIINNSINKAMCAFRNMCGDNKNNVVFLDLVLGIDLVSFYNGRINESVTGELGHTTVIKDGPKCFCGNRGCLELVCSEEHVVGNYREITGNKASELDEIFKLAEKGDKTAKQVLKEAAEYLGISIANIVSLFEPEKIIINKNRLISCPFIYKTALKEANERGYNLMFKHVVYECVSVSDVQAIQGLSQYSADRIFALDGNVL